MPVYVGKNVTVTITKTSSGDMGAFLAQSFTIEPKQAVEAIDALGSDYIEEWAQGLKTFEGTLVEPFMVDDDGSGGSTQLARLAALEDVDTITEYTMTVDWEQESGGFTLSLAGVIFPEPSLSTPKNKPTMITTKFKARTCTYTSGGGNGGT